MIGNATPSAELTEAIEALEAFRGLPHHGDAVLVLHLAARKGETLPTKRLVEAFSSYQDGLDYGKPTEGIPYCE